MIYLFIIVNLLLFIIFIRKYKDYLCPICLYFIPWLASSIGLLFTSYDFNPNSIVYFYMTIGSILFSIGFVSVLPISSKMYKNRLQFNCKKYHTNFKSIKIVLLIEMIFTVLLYLSMSIFIIKNYNGNIYNTIFLSQKNIIGENIFAYGRFVILAITISIMVNYTKVLKNEKQLYAKYMVVQVVILVLTAITRLTRNGMFFSFLPIIFCFLMINKKNNRKVKFYGIVTLTVFMIIFSYVAISQSVFSQDSILMKISNQFLGYLSSPLAALQVRLDNYNEQLMYGQGTFRFFIAVADKIFNTNFSIDLVQSYTEIGIGKITNVYSIYYFYYMDFGWLYALFIQFILGALYGYIYKKLFRKDFWPLFIYSILIYPLLFQFFQDQYLSLFSTYVQLFITAFIFKKFNLILYRKN